MTCTICGNSSRNKIHIAEERLYGLKEKFEYCECSECDCVQIVEIPKDMRKYYPKDYSGFTSSDTNNIIRLYLSKKRDSYAVFGKSLVGKFLYKNHPQEALYSLRTVNPAKTMRILDVGCGSGNLLFKLRELGFNYTTGVDPYIDNTIEYRNGLTIQKSYIFEVQGKWDLIMFHHSFEHIKEQKETLKKVFDLLDNDGVCMIRIPIVSSWAWQNYGVRWIQFDAPRHFYLHSLKSFSLLAEQTSFNISETIFDSSDLQFWGSEQNMHNIPLHSPQSFYCNRRNSIFKKEQIKHYQNTAKELNEKKLGDQAIFLLRKKGGR